jgi:hypothetical protein
MVRVLSYGQHDADDLQGEEEMISYKQVLLTLYLLEVKKEIV